MEIWSFSKICCNSEATLAWTGFVCWDSQWEVAESEESPRNARGCWRGGGCWRRFIQPTERTATLEPRRAAPFHYLQGLEKTNHATLRSAKEKELQSQVPSREFSISRRKNVFHSWSWWAKPRCQESPLISSSADPAALPGRAPRAAALPGWPRKVTSSLEDSRIQGKRWHQETLTKEGKN